MRTNEMLRFEASIMPEPNTGCWLWTGGLNAKGYGVFWDGGKNRSAHRLSYELANGPAPDGLALDHKCRQRSCVNPSHLEPVTNLENTRRSPLVCSRRGKATCKHGHSLTGDNLYTKRGVTECVECRREAARRQRRKAKSILALLNTGGGNGE